MFVKVIYGSNDPINSITSLFFFIKEEATHPNCGNILIAFSTPLLCESIINIQGNDLGQSNNEKDWKIRSQVPKCV